MTISLRFLSAARERRRPVVDLVPGLIDDETEVVPAKPTSSVGILPIILVTVALCAALCGGNDDTDPRLE